MKPTPKPLSADAQRAAVREAIQRASPGLLAFVDLAREKIDAKLTYLETPDLTLGRKPADWIEP